MIPVTSCIEWDRSFFRTGYGAAWWRGQMRTAHRVAWEKAHGPIPESMDVCHRCDNRRCVNLDHLFLGTRSENMRDAVAKGRHMHGERHTSAKLTEFAVREIRRLAREGVGQREIARRFGVNVGTIRPILTGRTWRHVDAY